MGWPRSQDECARDRLRGKVIASQQRRLAMTMSRVAVKSTLPEPEPESPAHEDRPRHPEFGNTLTFACFDSEDRSASGLSVTRISCSPFFGSGSEITTWLKPAEVLDDALDSGQRHHLAAQLGEALGRPRMVTNPSSMVTNRRYRASPPPAERCSPGGRPSGSPA